MRGRRFAETATTRSVGSRPADQLIESIDAAQDGDGIDLGMECEMAAAEAEARGPGMARIDETDNRQPAPGFVAQGPDQLLGSAPGSQENDPALFGLPGPGHDVFEKIHETQPYPRRRYGSRARKRLGSMGLLRGTYHPDLSRDSFVQALRSAGPTLNLSYSEKKKNPDPSWARPEVV